MGGLDTRAAMQRETAETNGEVRLARIPQLSQSCLPGFILLSVPLLRSAPAITAVRRVIPCLRHHAGIAPCLGHPAFSAEMRSSVLQVFRSSLFPRNEGLPEELDRGAEMTYPFIFWSSVSVIFRSTLISFDTITFCR
jgi:hypothetical protein